MFRYPNLLLPLVFAACQVLSTQSRLDSISRAVERDDLTAVQEELARPIDLNKAVPGAKPPLCIALDRLNPGMVKLLIARGARANLGNCLGVTPLMHTLSILRSRELDDAQFRALVAILDLLIKEGAGTELEEDNPSIRADRGRLVLSSSLCKRFVLLRLDPPMARELDICGAGGVSYVRAKVGDRTIKVECFAFRKGCRADDSSCYDVKTISTITLDGDLIETTPAAPSP